MNVFRSRNVLGHGAATIHVANGVIERIGEYDDFPAGVDFGDFVIMPGVVDTHVHVNEPGRTEWEGFETATRAAAAGGVTTIVDMPLNSIPPTTTVAALMAKVEAMSGKLAVDAGLWGGAVPGNAHELRDLLAHGALGFKCFLVDSGVPEFGHLDAGGLDEALRVLSGTGAPLLVHAECGRFVRTCGRGRPHSYRDYLASRPNIAEDAAIALVAAAAEKSGAHAHIVHLSSASALDAIRRARNVTAETTPHYLYFEAESIPDGAPEYKCAPPIREHDNREELWRGVRDGAISAIVSDHSPCTPELKRLGDGDVARAWGGIASLQFALPAVWTEARRRGIDLEAVSMLMSEGPTRLAGIDGRKGRLAAGYDADFVVFAPDETFRVEPDMIEHRHKITPYAGHELYCVVKATYVRGVKAERGVGQWVR